MNFHRPHPNAGRLSTGAGPGSCQETAACQSRASRTPGRLRRAQLRLAEAGAAALAPSDLDGRELAVLAVLAAEYPLSQLEAAGRLGIDRTTMVALVDDLERKGLV